MAPRVLFFGQDMRRSIPVLQRVGYSVDAYDSVAQIESSLIEESGVAAVAVSGIWEPLHDPILSTRERTRLPFVLFALPEERPATSMFDLVIPARQPPAEWLGEFDLLIRQCRETRKEARRVLADSDLLSRQTKARVERLRLQGALARSERESAKSSRERSRHERARLRQEISRNAGGSAGWDIEDLPALPDFACDPEHGFVPCEERDKLSFSLIQEIATLTHLLHGMVKEKLSDAATEQIDATQAEASATIAKLESLLNRWKIHRAFHRC